MKNYAFTPKGACPRKINFSVDENNCLHDVVYTGGCNGNLKAIGKLIEGMNVSEYIKTLSGNTCGVRSTSCTDQLAQALINEGYR